MDPDVLRATFFLGVTCGGILGGVFFGLLCAALTERTYSKRITKLIGEHAARTVLAEQRHMDALDRCHAAYAPARSRGIDYGRITRSLERAADATGAFRKPILPLPAPRKD